MKIRLTNGSATSKVAIASLEAAPGYMLSLPPVNRRATPVCETTDDSRHHDRGYLR